MKLGRVYILLLVCLHSYVQSQMIYTLQTSSNSGFINISSEIGTNNYIVQNEYVNMGTTIEFTKSQLLKISPTGTLLDSLNFGYDFDMGSPIVAHNNFYYCYGTFIQTISSNDQHYTSVLFKIDQNLNIVKQAVIDTGVNNIVTSHRITLKNNRIFIGNNHFNSNLIYIYKTDLNLVKLDSTKFDGFFLSDMSNYGTRIIICGLGFSQGSFFGNNQVVDMDTSFVVFSRLNLDNLKTVNAGCTQTVGIVSPLASLYEISANKYAVIGNYQVVNSASCTSKDQNIVSIIKNNSQVVNTQIIGDRFQNNEICGSMTPGNVKYNFIYTVAETGYDNQNPFPPQTNTTQILIHKVDTLGNLVWVKYFSEPDMYYIPYKALATSDSGVVICGMRYNIANPAVQDACEGFVMKIDKDGNQVFVGIKENSGKFLELKCFPNPSNDRLFFDIPFEDKIELSIYSTLGEEVHTVKDYQGLAPIKIDEFSNGVYFYKVKTKTKNYSGKFIKE